MKKKYAMKTKYGVFDARIWYDKSDNVWLAETVGFNRTMTHGDTISRAKAMVKELLELLVECEMEEGRGVVDITHRIYGKRLKPNSVFQLVPHE